MEVAGGKLGIIMRGCYSLGKMGLCVYGGVGNESIALSPLSLSPPCLCASL